MSGLATAARRRFEGTNVTDAWGLDVDLHALVAPVLRRVPLDLVGDLPGGPVLVIARRRLRVAVAALRQTGRVVRVLGIPDIEPAASLLRRLGGAVAHPAEAGNLLRAGNLVVAAPTAALLAAAERTAAAIVEVDHDLRVSERWLTSPSDAVHLQRARDEDPLRGHGSRRR